MKNNTTLAGCMVVGAMVVSFLGFSIDQSSDGVEIDVQHEKKTKAIVVSEHKFRNPNVFMGVDQCLRCHLNGLSTSKDTPPLFKDFTSSDDQWIQFDEIKIWSTKDKHSQAYSVLLGKLSRKMERLLGVKDLHRDKRCLVCHSSYPLHAMQTDAAGLVNEKLTLDRKITLGVSCEGCHGSAGGTEGWYDPHQIAKWRSQSAEVKEMKYGYYNIHSPVARAELCATCHIGNVEQGRIVTHEMYAAGHPPLGAFEIESYLDQMPLHWKRVKSKNQKLRDYDDFYFKQTGRKFDPNELHRTKSMLLGAVVSFREAMKLAADLADSNVIAPIKKPHWPEFSQFACFACHHDLKTNGWRQNRKNPVTPGRPMLHEWPSTLLLVAVQQSRGNIDDFQKQHAAVIEVFSKQPFGKQSDINIPLRELISKTGAIAEHLEESKLDSTAGFQILNQLSEIGSTKIQDYDGARQLAWALRVVFDECKSSTSRLSAEKKNQMENILKELENHLTLTFPKRKEDKMTLSRKFPNESEFRKFQKIPLEKTLPRIADYNPLSAKKYFTDFRILLQKQ